MRTGRNTGESRRSIQEADLQERQLGIGSPTSASKAVGVQNARWASVNLTGGGALGSEREFDVPHDLRSVPSTCDLVEWENAVTPATYLVSRPVRKESWSHSHAVVRILLVAGSFDGTVARFMVRGA